MAQTMFSEIVAPAVKKMSNNITKALGYVIYSSKHVNDMNEQLRVLKNTKVDVKKRMETNTLNNKDIPFGVSHWVKSVEAETMKDEAEITSSEGYGCLNIIRRYGAGKKACEATKRIKDLTTENNSFVWTDAPIPRGRVPSKPPTSTPSSHGVNFKSRDRSFNKALKWLQQDNNESQVIALCGMGGVGKTTMMEQLRTKAKNQQMFGYIVPVVIGRTPNMHSIQNDISIRLKGKGLEEMTKDERANSLCEKFKHILEVEKKRILVTLDDVWKKIELKDIGLTSPLPNGLKLFLTSRESDICRQIAVSAHSHNSFKVVEVEVLTEEEAQHLFFKITNVSKEDNRYDIGCQIVEKCSHLPLAINIIGTALQSQEMHVWNYKLQRLNKNNIDHDLQEVIKISYEYRDKEDKEILLLCGLFPEDYDIRIEDLTRYAWGLNLFEGVSTLGGARDSTRTCVGNLINAHLLINSNKHGCVRMHDLVLYFVLNVVSKSDRAWIINHGDVTQLAGREESCKKMSLTCMDMSEFPQDFKYPNLSFLQLMNGESSLKFPYDFYENMKNLQVIAYYNMQYPLLPRSLHCSTNLKSLCLYKCKLMFDLSFVRDLVNLEVLSFAHCGIHKLPSAIGKLVKLKLLDLTGCENLSIDNGVFKNLKNLEELYMRASSYKNVRFTESNIKELAMLSKQLFALEVEFVEKENLFEFFSFEKLDKFKIAIGGYFPSYQLEKDPFVNKLKLVSDCNIDLHNCKINKLFKKTEHLYLQVKDMIGLEDRHSFSCLKSLEVYECSNLKYLFPVCVANGLKKLETLRIHECRVLEALIKNDGSEINGVVELPQLHQLYLDDLPNFTSIYPDNSSSMCALFNSQVKFPKLEKLKIGFMEKLKQIWGCEFGSSEKEEVNNFSMLREIEVYECDSLVNLFPSNPMRLLTHLERLVVKSCGSIKELFNIDQECNGHEVENNFSMLRKIEVWKCDSLVNLFPSNPMRLLTHLERLHVRSCSSIKELFNIDLECIGHEVENNFSMLREIEVDGCDSLVNLFPSNPMRLLTHLERLHVRSCSSIKELFNIDLECNGHEGENNISMLREIEVDGCDSLVNLFPSNPMRLLTHLERLHVRSCSSIKELFNIDLECNGHEGENNISMLREIEVDGCDSLVNLFPSNPMRLLTHLERLHVRSCSSIKALFNIDLECNGHEVENNISMLREIEVEGCYSLVNLFPSNLMRLLTNLKSLELKFCGIDMESSGKEDLKVVFEVDLNNQQPLLPNLQSLDLCYMNDMSHVWKCNNWNKYLSIIPPQRRYSSFHNLTSITIYKCNRIKYLFSPLMVKLLSNLQSIYIQRCDEMKEVVSNRDDDDDDKDDEETTTFFPRLHSLTFENLTNLIRIGGGGQSNSTKTSVIQHKVSHVGVVSWSLCQFSKEIIIYSCNGLSSVIPLDAIGQMQKLEVLRVTHCESLKEVFDSQYINGNSGDCKSRININKGSVDINAISRQSNINMTPLSNLKILEIISCNLLQHVFTFFMIESLKHLEELKVQDCKAMKVIVEKENEEQTKDVVFRSLKLLELSRLPNLEGFFLGMNNFNWPLLEKVKIIECPQMMNFTCGQSTTPALKDIHTSLGGRSLECGLNFQTYT
ncbi:hypothetical protein E3N88_00098 [Mikania micrantha]|uniref:Uncharacterized protein n=1 Tax=Mikania micrantha TaxID=192012 RepID=A0A5N6PXK3_9ASTR|nr:hypothetical protein E3N88_00098 [Mikania micrantha]